MGELARHTIEVLRKRLADRLDALHAKVGEHLNHDSLEGLAASIGEVHDAGDESVGIEQVQLRNALLGRHVGEVREVEAALTRIAEGVYGVCDDCGTEIETARLEAYPIALRCSPCQEIRERRRALRAAPTVE
jgi:DnaK suppressor protein